MEFKLLAPCIVPSAGTVHALVSIPAGGTQGLRLLGNTPGNVALDVRFTVEEEIVVVAPGVEAPRQERLALLRIALPAPAYDQGPASLGVPIHVVLEDPGGASAPQRPVHDYACLLVMPRQTFTELEQLWHYMVYEVASAQEQQAPGQADDPYAAQIRHLLSSTTIGPPSSDRALWPGTWRQFLLPLLHDLASLLRVVHALPGMMRQAPEAGTLAQTPGQNLGEALPPGSGGVEAGASAASITQGAPSTESGLGAQAGAGTSATATPTQGAPSTESGPREAGAGTSAAAPPTHRPSRTELGQGEAGAGTGGAASTAQDASRAAGTSATMHHARSAPPLGSAQPSPAAATVTKRNSLSEPNLTAPQPGASPPSATAPAIVHHTPAPPAGEAPDVLQLGPPHVQQHPQLSASAPMPSAEILPLSPVSDPSQAPVPGPLMAGGKGPTHSPELPRGGEALMPEGAALALNTLPVVDRVSGYLRQQPHYVPGLLKLVEEAATACHCMLMKASEQLTAAPGGPAPGMAATLSAPPAQGATPSAPPAEGVATHASPTVRPQAAPRTTLGTPPAEGAARHASLSVQPQAAPRTTLGTPPAEGAARHASPSVRPRAAPHSTLGVPPAEGAASQASPSVQPQAAPRTTVGVPPAEGAASQASPSVQPQAAPHSTLGVPPAEGMASQAFPSPPQAPGLPLSIHDLPELPPGFVERIDSSLMGSGPDPPNLPGVASDVPGESLAQHHFQHRDLHEWQGFNWPELPQALRDLARVTALGFWQELGFEEADQELEIAYHEYLISKARSNSIFRVSAAAVVILAAIWPQPAFALLGLGDAALYLLPPLLKLAAIAYPGQWPDAPLTARRTRLVSKAHVLLSKACFLTQAAWWMYPLARGGDTEAHSAGLGLMLASQLCVDFCGAVGALNLPVSFIDMLPCFLSAMATPFLASFWDAVGSMSSMALRYGFPCSALSVMLLFMADMRQRQNFVRDTITNATLHG